MHDIGTFLTTSMHVVGSIRCAAVAPTMENHMEKMANERELGLKGGMCV